MSCSAHPLSRQAAWKGFSLSLFKAYREDYLRRLSEQPVQEGKPTLKKKTQQEDTTENVASAPRTRSALDREPTSQRGR